MAITDKLITVAENTPKVYEAGRNSVFKQFPESLKGSAIGTTCALTDISSIEHTIEVKLSSKNFFNLEAFSDSSNWIVDANNANAYRSFKLNLYPNTTYTFLHGDGVDSNPTGYALYALFSPTPHNNSALDSQWIISSGNNARTNEKITFTTNSTGVHYINIYYDTGRLQHLAAYLSTARIEIDISKVKLVKSGLNIWDEQWELGSIDGTGANQTATNTIRSKNYIPVKGGVKYGIFAPQMSKVVCYDANKKYYTLSYPSMNESFTPSQDGYVRFAIGGSVGTSPAIAEYGNNICISVYSGRTVGIYEPYIEPIEYQAEADGTVKGVTSKYPTTMLTTDAGVIINCNYIRDIETPIISLIEGDIIEFEIPQGASKIGHGAFYACQQLKRISIPNTVISIGERAFYQCYALNDVVFPDSLKSLGFGAFYMCTSLENISIPNTVTTMGYEIFRSCTDLKNAIFEEGSPLTQIPNYTFTDCKALEKIKIPSKVTLIGTQAFKNCSACLEYDFSEVGSIPALYTNPFDGINKNAKIIVPEDLFLNWINAASWMTYKDYITTPKNGFAILNEQYIANEGMTWGEWVDSNYSKEEFTVDEYGYVYNSQSYQVTLVTTNADGSYNYHYVTYDEEIIKGEFYNAQ